MTKRYRLLMQQSCQNLSSEVWPCKVTQLMHGERRKGVALFNCALKVTSDVCVSVDLACSVQFTPRVQPGRTLRKGKSLSVCPPAAWNKPSFVESLFLVTGRGRLWQEGAPKCGGQGLFLGLGGDPAGQAGLGKQGCPRSLKFSKHGFCLGKDTGLFVGGFPYCLRQGHRHTLAPEKKPNMEGVLSRLRKLSLPFCPCLLPLSKPPSMPQNGNKVSYCLLPFCRAKTSGGFPFFSFFCFEESGAWG
ncbi:hypothetical protein BaRGS_00030290 [Batillaria attramentaria]|uniref:Uncharacterized protein n=1 Tax=Batillaria attramentaria TaxID=370345 RepID=A0ABD0JTT1_9CAEN